MEEIDKHYDYYQHSYCMALYLNEDHLRILKFSNVDESYNRDHNLGGEDFLDETTVAIYDKQSEKMLYWGDEAKKHVEEKFEGVCILTNFLSNLYRIYQKKKEGRNSDDLLVLKIIGIFFKLMFVKLINLTSNKEMLIAQIITTSNFYYAFIVPTEWDHTIREEIIRLIFIEANLLDKTDPSGRLLFLTRLDCSLGPDHRLYDFAIRDNENVCDLANYKKNIHYLFLETDMTVEDVVTIKCDAFELFNSPSVNNVLGLFMSPEISRSEFFEVPLKQFLKAELSELLVEKGFSVDLGTQGQDLLYAPMSVILEYFAYQNRIYDFMNGGYTQKLQCTSFIEFYSEFREAIHRTRTLLPSQLDRRDLLMLAHISPEEVYGAAFAPIEQYIIQSIESLFPPSTARKKTIIPRHNEWTLSDSDLYLWWIERVLVYYRKYYNYSLLLEESPPTTIAEWRDGRIFSESSISMALISASSRVMDKIRLSRLLMSPQILIDRDEENFNDNNCDIVIDQSQKEEVGNNDDVKKKRIFRKKRKITQGEGLLPLLQEKFKLSLPLKSYFVQAQLHEEFLQLILNQVVKLKSPKEEAASIIIQDQTIPIQNIYDSLCANIWKSIGSCDGSINVNCCEMHKDNINIESVYNQNFAYLQNDRKKVQLALKNYILDTFSNDSSIALDLDKKRIIEIGSSCNCSIGLTLRDFIAIAIMPTLMSITSIISAAIVNANSFGKYAIDYLFILGDIFGYSNYDSYIHKIFMGLIKEALIISNEEKEIEPKCFFRLHSLQDIMKANVMSKRSSYLFDSIGKGILCQVAKEAYSLCFTSHYYDSSSYGHECPPAACPILLCQSNDPPDRPSLDEIHHERRRSLVVLQKGQILPYEGIKMMIYIKYDKLQVKNALYTQLHIRKLHLPYNKHGHSQRVINASISERVLSINHFPFDAKKAIDKFGLLVVPLLIEIKPINYSCSLQFSINYAHINGTYDYAPFKFTLAEPLTVAYI